MKIDLTHISERLRMNRKSNYAVYILYRTRFLNGQIPAITEDILTFILIDVVTLRYN